MSLKKYLIIMAVGASICWLTFLKIISTIDPLTTNRVGFFLFYASLFLSVVGTSAIIGFIIRFLGLKREMISRSVRSAFRQSFLFAFLIIAILLLLSHNVFNWLNLLALVIGLSVLEFFLLSYQGSRELKNRDVELRSDDIYLEENSDINFSGLG